MRIVEQIWDKVLVAAGTLGVALTFSPLNMPTPPRDSGVFLYIGWRILNGELPYRDIWDHKPPLIYYIDALGLSMTPHSAWGVWLLGWIALSIAAYLGFRLARTTVGTVPAILGSFLLLLTALFLLPGGNLTEEYALPLQFACLWLIHDFESGRFPQRRLFLIGIVSGLAFFTKQTTIGIGAAIVLYLTADRLSSRRVSQLLRELLAILAGGLTVCMVVVAFFAAHGALREFWSAVFGFNFAYVSSGGTIPSHLISLLLAISPVPWVWWLLVLSLIGYAVGLLIFAHRNRWSPNWMALLCVGLLDLPLEFALFLASSRLYRHYLISILPALSLFSALAFWGLFSRLPRWARTDLIKGIFTVAFIGVFLGSSSAVIAGLTRDLGKLRPTQSLIREVTTSTSPDDTVQVWGNEASLNYAAYRRSPSRFVYLTPLYQRNYADEQMTEAFLDDLIRNRPRLIIDANDPATPMYKLPVRSEAIQSALDYLESHYRLTESLGGWTIYEYSENVDGP